MKAWVYWVGGVVGYIVPAICMGAYIVNHGLERPFIGAALWPLRLIKILLGGG